MLFASAFLAVMNAPKGSRTDGLLVHAKRVFPCVFMVAALWGVSIVLNPILPRLKAPKITAKKRGGFGTLFGGVAVSVAYYSFVSI